MSNGFGTQLVYESESSRIRDACYEVHKTLGPGFLEKVYENALTHELDAAGLGYERQKSLRVLYKGVEVGSFIADIVVEDRIVLELKAVNALMDAHKSQLRNYLMGTDLKLGILVNFGSEKMEFKRVVNTKIR